ncbi:MAG: MaoC family dehydratase [Pseudomonadales bacterium]|nr:MaoC family dehydratase [Pseudomonadales bacterium]MCP5183626.1 MaoC family dehydratase [Pseudomonadales bacterium]
MNVHVGDEVPAWDMPSVRPERMRTMAAILRDPYPVHWDRRAVAAIGLGDRCINQGPLGLSYMVNMLHDWTGFGSIRRIRMTFPLPVFEGDHIVARGKVTAVREEGGRRLADCDIWLEREGTSPPLIGNATVQLPAD